ncbi:MAG: glutaminase A [Akkermansia sp.]
MIPSTTQLGSPQSLPLCQTGGCTPTLLKSSMDRAIKTYSPLKDGANANYIPALARVPSNLFGIAGVCCDGTIVESGDSEELFAIESISKMFSLAWVIDKIGQAELRAKIGANPTGEPFNSVMAIELHGGKPLNPFVNAGAMATVSLIPGQSSDDIWAIILSNLEAFAGHPLTVNQEVYQSESATNQHNRGIAWLLRSYGYFYNDPDMIVDLYTRMCSVQITTKDLAVMGSAFANGGVNPVTGVRVLQEQNVPPVLAEMGMSGLYDSTGAWMYAAGLPGKSGVGGGIVTVAPRHLAMAAFSPPLDSFGNSVRAQAGLKDIIEEFGLNLFKS